MPGSDADGYEYEETPWDSEEEEEAEEAVPQPQPEFATGVLRDGRRFAAVFCSPTMGPLAYWAEAQEMLDAGVLSSDANLSQGATLDAVKKLMRDFDPHILWFVGHGNAVLAGALTLCWTTGSGNAVLIDARVCSDVLSAYTPKRGGSLECVVLNACETMKDGAALGRLLHEAGVPFVAGWRSIVADAAAPFFARGFLAALQGGKDYAEAYELGKLEVKSQTEGPDPSLRNLKTAINGSVGRVATQRFQLVDPKSALVVQKAEVNAPHWRPACHGTLHLKWAHRVRQGQLGEGRLAAGVPDHRENTPPPPFGVPMLPPKHLPRPAAVDAVVKHLCAPLAHQGVLIAGKVLGVHGMGGIGKTVLCQLVCQRPRVRYRFPDGILWLTVSEEPDIVQLQSRLRDHLRNYQAGARVLRTPSEGRDELRQLLQDKACLVILDDVWYRRHFDELIGGCVAGSSQILISTRNVDQFSSGTPTVLLDQLDDAGARELLLLTADLGDSQLPQDVESAVAALVRRSGGLPLALCIIGALVEGDTPEERQAALVRLGSHQPELQLPMGSAQLNMPYAHGSVMECIEMSRAALPDDVTRQRFLDLALYPEDATVPLQALALRWCPDLDFAGDAAADSVRGILRLLRKRSLLMLEGDAFRLHDLVRAYLRARAGADGLRSSQVALLALYRERSCVPGVWASVPRDGYIHEHLLYHIKEAEGAAGEDAAALLGELRPLQVIGSEASLDFRTQTHVLKKHALLSTRPHDEQLWQRLIVSDNEQDRLDAVGLTLSLGLHLDTKLEQLRRCIDDPDVKVAARAIEVGEVLQPDMCGEALFQTLSLSGTSDLVRRAALTAIGKLSPEALAEHAPALIVKLADSDFGVREAAVKALGKLEAAVLAQCAPALVAKLEHSEWGVRQAAVQVLGKVEASVLAQHAPAIVAKLERSDEGVRQAAVEALGKLEAEALAQHAPAIVAKLEHSNEGVRQAAVEVLGKLKAAVLAQHAPTLVAKLEHSEWGVRWAAMEALGKLEASVLAQLAPTIVAKLEHSNVGVRQAAVEALGQLEAAVLAQHAPTIIAKLEDSNEGVRQAAVRALGKLEASVLAKHAPALVAKLEDPNRHVRFSALQTLRKLKAAVLAQHAAALLPILEDSDVGVRRSAIEALGKLEEAVLAQHAPVLVAKLEDPNGHVRGSAVQTLGKLKAAVLAQHAAALVAKLEASDGGVRQEALQTLGKLEAAALAQHAPTLVAKLEHSNEHVRQAALLMLGKLEAAALARHARALVAKLEHSDGGVRWSAVEALGKLEAAALARHAPTLVAKLEHSDSGVLIAALVALGKLEAAVLAQHAPALVAKLEHSDEGVRRSAVEALGKLEAEALAQHAPTLVAKLEDSDSGVLIAALVALGNLEAAVLAQHAPALVAKLEHSDEGVRFAAVLALGKLKAAVLAQHAPVLVAKLEDSNEFVRQAVRKLLNRN